ncbi:hypothetical protein FBQ48_25925, partial [Escherichia coli]|nr:hypothetical protein [Escherichia coli]EFE7550889.1 hypothetical protein [Escherichia coli]
QRVKKKFKKWLPGRKESTGWKESPLKQTDRHHKSPGGDLCIRDSSDTGKVQNGNYDVWRQCEFTGTIHRFCLPLSQRV